MTAPSNSSPAARLTCPPSPDSTSHTPFGPAIAAETPSPVPGPMTAIGARGARSQSPIRRSSWCSRKGAAAAMALKSLTSSTRAIPASATAVAEITQSRLVSVIAPPSIGPAAQIAASAGHPSSPSASHRHIASANDAQPEVAMTSRRSSAPPASRSAKRTWVPPTSASSVGARSVKRGPSRAGAPSGAR